MSTPRPVQCRCVRHKTTAPPKRRKLRQLEAWLAHSNLAEPLKRARYQSGQQDMESIFTEYLQWIEDAMTTEDTPWVQVVAALVGDAAVSPTGSRRPLSPDEESLQCRHACFP